MDRKKRRRSHQSASQKNLVARRSEPRAPSAALERKPEPDLSDALLGVLEVTREFGRLHEDVAVPAGDRAVEAACVKSPGSSR